MMLHRHFEEARKKANENITFSHDVQPHSSTTDVNDPLYVPLDDSEHQIEEQPRRGRPRKS